MAHDPNLLDLGEAEKGMCAPAPVSASCPDSMFNTTTLIDLGFAEKDYYSDSANSRTAEETVLLQNLEGVREKHRQLVEDWVLEMKALFLKDLPHSRYLESNATPVLKTWLLDSLDSPSHRGDDSRIQLRTRLSEALKQSDEHQKVVVFLDGLLPWLILLVGILGWVLSALLRSPTSIAWYDCVIMGLGNIMMQVLVLVYVPRKKVLTWHDRFIVWIAPNMATVGVVMVIFPIVCRFAWHIEYFGRTGGHGDS